MIIAHKSEPTKSQNWRAANFFLTSIFACTVRATNFSSVQQRCISGRKFIFCVNEHIRADSTIHSIDQVSSIVISMISKFLVAEIK